MSVCIAIRFDDKQLVYVTDNRVSFGSFSGENVSIKADHLHFAWQIMFAGNEVEHATPIIRSAGKSLLKHPGRPHEPEEVANAVDVSFSEQLQTQINNKILRKHGYSIESFKEKAKLKCSPEIQLKVWEKIDREKLSLQFLVCGFDKNRVGHIWLVDGENAPVCYDSIDFWAIGSGASAALNRIALHLSKHKMFSSIEEVVYVAVTAKFAAEAASDVGRSTFVAVHKHPLARKDLEMLSPDGMERLRTIWNRTGIPPVPQSACKLITQDMADLRKELRRK